MRKAFDNILDRLSLKLTQALEYIRVEDVENARKEIDEYRFLRSAVMANWIDQAQKHKIISHNEITVALKKLNIQLEAEKIISKYVHRLDDVLSIETACKSAEGIDYLIDTMLPLTWDFERDLIFLFSEFATDIAARLRLRGQKNIVIYGKIRKSELALYADSKEASLIAVNKMEPLPSYLACIEPLDISAQKDDIIKVHSELSEAIRFFEVNDHTINKFNFKWAVNKIKNAPFMIKKNARSLEEFKTYFKDNDVVVVCPGPSLRKDIDRLKKVQEKIIILAAAQACPALSDAEITPDFICVSDTEPLSYMLQDVDFSGVSAVILSDSVDTSVVQTCQATDIIFVQFRNFVYNIDTFLKQPVFDITGQGVLINMVKIASGYDAASIGLLGVDLSLSHGDYFLGEKKLEKPMPNEKLEDKFYWHEETKRRVRKIFIQSNSGDEIFTKYDYHEFIIALEFFAEQQVNNSKLVNFSKDGAAINGFEYKEFENFIENLSIKKTEKQPTLNIFAKKFNPKKEVKKLLKKHERETKLFEIYLRKALYKLRSDKAVTKEIEKMLELLKESNFLSLTLKLDIEIFLRQIRKVDLGDPSKSSKILFFKSIMEKSEILKKELLFTNKILDKF